MACTTLPNFRAIASKMRSLEGVKFFHKTGNRKILARYDLSKNWWELRGPSPDVPAKFKENRIWKF